MRRRPACGVKAQSERLQQSRLAIQCQREIGSYTVITIRVLVHRDVGTACTAIAQPCVVDLRARAVEREAAEVNRVTKRVEMNRRVGCAEAGQRVTRVAETNVIRAVAEVTRLRGSLRVEALHVAGERTLCAQAPRECVSPEWRGVRLQLRSRRIADRCALNFRGLCDARRIRTRL